MEIIRTISVHCETKNLSFLVAGGHAVAAYGISRQTADIDFIVSKEQKSAWVDLLIGLNYKSFQDDERFSRFKSNDIAAWPIDLMYVDQVTFDKMYGEATFQDFGITKAKVVSARHLATLKIHALKYYQVHREPKDYGDLLGLLRSGRAKFEDNELKSICEKYASIDLYTRIKKDLN